MSAVKQRASLDAMLHRFVAVLAMVFIMLVPSLSHAQGIDTEAPVIELEELAEGIADRSQVFTVQIAEDGQLKDATLYYRREGQLPFTPAPMQPLGDTGYFSVSIPTSTTDLRTIEYYVQARDEAGNRTVSGFAFDPYKRVLSASPTAGDGGLADTAAAQGATNTGPADAAPNSSFFQRRWVQITLGVLAVGALASLTSDNGGSDTEVVPLTINLQ